MIELKINPFYMGTDKEAALKLLEEAAEAYGEWDGIDKCPGQCDGCRMRECCDRPDDFTDEIADVIQAACNLANRFANRCGIDLQAAMEQCEERNRARGRYGDNE